MIDKSTPPAGLLAQVIVAKYADHLPMYRSERIFGRAGLAIPRSTLAEWVGACSSTAATASRCAARSPAAAGRHVTTHDFCSGEFNCQKVLTVFCQAVLFATSLQRPPGFGSEDVTQVVE